MHVVVLYPEHAGYAGATQVHVQDPHLRARRQSPSDRAEHCGSTRCAPSWGRVGNAQISAARSTLQKGLSSLAARFETQFQRTALKFDCSPCLLRCQEHLLAISRHFGEIFLPDICQDLSGIGSTEPLKQNKTNPKPKKQTCGIQLISCPYHSSLSHHNATLQLTCFSPQRECVLYHKPAKTFFGALALKTTITVNLGWFESLG